MAQLSSVLKSALDGLNLRAKEELAANTEFRGRLEHSALLEMMMDVTNQINNETEMLLIEVQSHVPPVAIVSSFCFKRDCDECLLQLEIWDARIVVAFLKLSWPKEISPESFGWIYRRLVPEEPTIDVKFKAVVQSENVTKEIVEEWFAYLISGFERKFRPSETMMQEPETQTSDYERPLHRSVIDPSDLV
jgi:hypothetical protein